MACCFLAPPLHPPNSRSMHTMVALIGPRALRCLRVLRYIPLDYTTHYYTATSMCLQCMRADLYINIPPQRLAGARPALQHGPTAAQPPAPSAAAPSAARAQRCRRPALPVHVPKERRRLAGAGPQAAASATLPHPAMAAGSSGAWLARGLRMPRSPRTQPQRRAPLPGQCQCPAAAAGQPLPASQWPVLV